MTYKAKKFFIICLVLSIAPVLFAGFWQFYGQANPTLQKGNLLEKTVYIQTTKFKDEEPKWYLTRVANFNCDTNCQGQMYLLERLRLATGKNQNRVKTAMVALKPIHSQDTVVVSKEKMNQIRRNILQDDIMIIDPRGQVVMSYKGDVDPRKISQDLKKLLKFSRLG